MKNIDKQGKDLNKPSQRGNENGPSQAQKLANQTADKVNKILRK